jgi:hypothetical protein
VAVFLVIKHAVEDLLCNQVVAGLSFLPPGRRSASVRQFCFKCMTLRGLGRESLKIVTNQKTSYSVGENACWGSDVGGQSLGRPEFPVRLDAEVAWT